MSTAPRNVDVRRWIQAKGFPAAPVEVVFGGPGFNKAACKLMQPGTRSTRTSSMTTSATRSRTTWAPPRCDPFPSSRRSSQGVPADVPST
jgi:hypothetical protein